MVEQGPVRTRCLHAFLDFSHVTDIEGLFLFRKVKNSEFVMLLCFPHCFTGFRTVYCFRSRTFPFGWLLGTAAESLRTFVEPVFAIFCGKSVVFFMISGKQAICGCQRTYSHTNTFPRKFSILPQKQALWKLSDTISDRSRKALRKLSESRLSKSSLKAARK